ncbi:MAG: LOG family protein [Acaryochloridaceae cyanobacterium RU_4_10]|nr:LOG family protein [Acaryochloridaceae cyanobacterium RU_4_10]
MNADFPELPVDSEQSNGLNCPLPNPRLSYEIVQSSILGLWDVVNQLSSIPPPKRDRYSVTLFGSARLPKDSLIYAGVRQLAAELTQMGCDIITGGGPGLMEAANEGSVLADPQNLTQSIGIRVALEFEQAVNPFVEQAYQHRTFFSRLHHFVLISDAFVVVPGGIGTTLEALTIWQLLQVRNLKHPPLIMVGPMWAELVTWAKAFMIDGALSLASPADMDIPICVEGFDVAIALLKADHQKWQNRC